MIHVSQTAEVYAGAELPVKASPLPLSRLVVCRALFLSQRRFGHHEGFSSSRAGFASAALREPLPTQVEDLAKCEEDAHKAGHHHEDSEYFLLCGPGEFVGREETHNVIFTDFLASPLEVSGLIQPVRV